MQSLFDITFLKEAFRARSRREGRHRWKFEKTAPPEVAGTPPLEAGTLALRLDEEKDFLLLLILGMETEFLATGNGLIQLSQQISENQKQCRSLTDLTLGQTDDAAVQFAFQLLKKAEDLVLASYEQYDHVFAAFREVQTRLAQLSRQHDNLMHVLLPLTFITLSFRIEASRHPQEVQQAFSTLAASINLTVSEVRRTMEQQFTELAASERIAHSVMEQVFVSIQQHRKGVALTLETSRLQLHALSESLLESGAEAADLSKLNQAVNRHIGGIVMAQQCQDITRQRIEHVGEAMDDMRTHLHEIQTGVSTTETDTHQFVFHAGQIQLHQVQNVFEQLDGAAESLKSGIQSLRAEAESADEVAIKVGGKSIDKKVADQCQTGVGEILEIVQQAVRKIADVITAFEPLQASFVDCTGRASSLANDVRLAGLNAQVFAIHAPNGATLEVLAGSVRVISQEVIEEVEKMGAALNHTTEMVNNLRQRLEDFQILGEAEQEVLAAESALSRTKLLDLDVTIPSLIEGITVRQGIFAKSVEEVLANVQFPATLAKASARSLGFFRELVEWGSQGEPGSGASSETVQKINQLQSKYTMESERLAHSAALLPAVVAAGEIMDEPLIEMFDDFASPVPSAGKIMDEQLIEMFEDFELPVASFGETSTGISSPGVQSQIQSDATVVVERETAPLAAAHSVVAVKPSADEDLGDNVDLF